MTLDRKLSIMRAFSYYLWQTALIMAAIVFFYIAPRIDAALFPVISGFQVTEKVISDEFTEIVGVMTKNRGECRFVSLTMISEGSPAGEPEKGYHIVFSSEDSYINRPEGSQVFGPWRIYHPKPPLGPIIRVEVVHECNKFWNTRTVLAQIPTWSLFPDAEILEDRL